MRSKEIDCKILYRYAYKIASNEDNKAINHWVSQCKKNQIYLNKFIADIRSNNQQLTLVDISKNWANFQRRYILKRLIIKYSTYAAVLVTVCTLAWMGKTISVQNNSFTSNNDLKLKSKALFITGNNAFVLGDTESKKIIGKKGNILANDNNNQLIINPNTQITNSIVKTDLACKYQIKLSDGTIVWLNAKSSLEFPNKFTDTIRSVRLKGEAIFKVKHNNSLFVVETDNSIIRVLGTTFNVTSYNDEKLQITLSEGKISVLQNNEEYFLKPGQQLANTINGVEIISVDPSYYMSWKQGIFYFDKMRLENLFNRLNKWHNFNFLFKDEKLKDKRFTGTIKQDTSIEKFMSLIEKSSNVKITIKNDIVFIEKDRDKLTN